MNDPVYARPSADVTKRWWDRLVWALLPAGCLGCDEPLPAAVSLLGLCRSCHGRLAPIPPVACSLCCTPLDAHEPPPDYRCGACRQDPPAFDRLLTLWEYGPPLDAVVQGLKFGRLDYLGRHFAEALAAKLGDRLTGCELVVPVPLHWSRRLTRGYNQAERIARPLASRLGLPFDPALTRRRATPPQSRLGQSERLANLRRAFRARSRARIEGRHLLLVDDVATTGATLDAAAGALKGAGAPPPALP